MKERGSWICRICKHEHTKPSLYCSHCDSPNPNEIDPPSMGLVRKIGGRPNFMARIYTRLFAIIVVGLLLVLYIVAEWLKKI